MIRCNSNITENKQSVSDGIKSGFTMAETLITIAIIGVLAAVITPAIFSRQPNREMVAYKKAYKLTTRILTELVQDDDLYNVTEGFQDPTSVSYNGERYGRVSPGEKFCNLFKARLAFETSTNCGAGGGTFTTPDKIVWTIVYAGDVSGRIIIDVPGSSRPRCRDGEADCNNPNRFFIDFDQFGRIISPSFAKVNDNYQDDSLERKYITTMDNTKKYREVRDLND